MIQKKYTVKIGNEDPALLLRWLRAVLNPNDIRGLGTSVTLNSVRGLELSRLKLNPSPSNYSAEIEFSRWEKRGK